MTYVNLEDPALDSIVVLIDRHPDGWLVRRGRVQAHESRAVIAGGKVTEEEVLLVECLDEEGDVDRVRVPVEQVGTSVYEMWHKLESLVDTLDTPPARIVPEPAEDPAEQPAAK